MAQVPLEEARVLGEGLDEAAVGRLHDAQVEVQRDGVQALERHDDRLPVLHPRAERVGAARATGPKLVRVLHEDEEERGRYAVCDAARTARAHEARELSTRIPPL